MVSEIVMEGMRAVTEAAEADIIRKVEELRARAIVERDTAARAVAKAATPAIAMAKGAMAGAGLSKFIKMICVRSVR